MSKCKRVLLIGGNYSPELTGIGKYNGEMIDMLARQGFQCSVITSFPYYPHWKVQEPYTKNARWFKKELNVVEGVPATIQPVEIFRCPHYIPGKPTGLKRMISDFSFCFSAFIKIVQFLFKPKYDFVIVVAPPFPLGLLGVLYQKIKGARLLYHIQDLQIDAARDFNLIKSAFIINLLLKVEKYILKRADVVSSISQGMIKKIKAKHPREVVFFPNWIDTSLFFPIPESEQLKVDFGFNVSDKIVLYSGAIGEKQGLEAILECAKKLEHNANLKFVICGSGPYKEKLEQMKQAQQLDNVVFLPLQPYDKLNFFLNMADIHLVLQKANAADLVMPSKLTAILSVGGLAIITANKNSSLFDVVDAYKMGVLVEPENQSALVAAIDNLVNNYGRDTNMNARLYAEEYLSIEQVFRKFVLQLS